MLQNRWKKKSAKWVRGPGKTTELPGTNNFRIRFILSGRTCSLPLGIATMTPTYSRKKWITLYITTRTFTIGVQLRADAVWTVIMSRANLSWHPQWQRNSLWMLYIRLLCTNLCRIISTPWIHSMLSLSTTPWICSMIREYSSVMIQLPWLFVTGTKTWTDALQEPTSTQTVKPKESSPKELSSTVRRSGVCFLTVWSGDCMFCVFCKYDFINIVK